MSKYDEEVALHPLKMAVVNTASTSLGSFGEVDDAEVSGSHSIDNVLC